MISFTRRGGVYPRPQICANTATGGYKPRPYFECRAFNEFTYRRIIDLFCRNIRDTALGSDTVPTKSKVVLIVQPLCEAVFQSLENLFLITIAPYKHQRRIMLTIIGFVAIISACIIKKSGSVRETNPSLAAK